MEVSQFERSLQAFQRRTRFRSFTVALVNGDRIQVDHSEALVLRDGVAVFIAAGGIPTLFDHSSVSQLVGEPPSQPSA
jgi:hypothetical protein